MTPEIVGYILGILSNYFIGIPYLKLAKKHGKKKWLFFFLGIIAFYIGNVFAKFIVIIYGYINPSPINNTVVICVTLFFSILSSVIVYQILKRKWSIVPQSPSNILDQDIFDK